MDEVKKTSSAHINEIQMSYTKTIVTQPLSEKYVHERNEYIL